MGSRLESIDSFKGDPYAAVAEIDVLSEAGSPLSHEWWTIAFVDSEERASEDGAAENAIDGQTANFWRPAWSDSQPNHPHRIVIDLGQPRRIGAVQITPRARGESQRTDGSDGFGFMWGMS